MTLNTFEFLVDQIPFGYAFNFDNYLFNKVKHINTQGLNERANYFIVNYVKKRIEGKIHFLFKDNIAYSPYKSLFGSFEFSPNIHPNLLCEFWMFIENDLKSRNVEKVIITNFAECYSPKKAGIVLKTMGKSGFSVALKAVNHHISIDEDPLEKKVHYMERKRLKKCEKNGFIFLEEPTANAIEIYDYIQSCRQEQNVEVSVSKDKFVKYLNEFPQNYFLFSVRQNGELTAATIAIKVHRRILYSFLQANLRKYNLYSPSVLLNVGMYNYCQRHQFEILDLGISTKPDGKNQDSLIEFKEHMAAKKSYKYFFEKEL